MSKTKIKSTKAINKIKINDKKVEVHYIMHHFTEDERVLNTKVPMESEVKPHKDFFDAFQSLKNHAISMMELSLFKGKVDEKTLEKHVVTTLTIHEDEEDTKVMVSMNKYLNSGKCFSCTSPLISLEHEDYDKLDEFRDQVDKVIAEAKAYLGGKNGEKQLEIKFQAA